jgi:heat shock protein HspQ
MKTTMENKMKIGDLVRHDQGFIGIIICIDPEQIGDDDEVEVAWNDGDLCNMSVWDLEVICESR